MKTKLFNALPLSGGAARRLAVPVSRVWLWPLVLGLASAGGLLAALLGDGAWDAASWCLLGWPVGVCLWFGLPRPAPRAHPFRQGSGKTFVGQGI